MNILGLIFSLLMILSFTFFACWEKQLGAHRLERTYVSHQEVARKILNRHERELYKNLRNKPNPNEPAPVASTDKKATFPKNPQLNQECSRLNLLPLIEEGPEAHPLLYEVAAKLFATFYKPLFEKKARAEYAFLNQFLSLAKTAAAKEPSFALEKIRFSPALQPIYYKMLKGTKEWNLKEGVGYPSLLDYVKVDTGEEKLCLSHAHPDLLTVLFGPNAGPKLYEEIHQKNHPSITRELIEQICSEAHVLSLDPDLFAFFQFGKPNHKSTQLTFIEKDEATHVALKKTIRLYRS